MILLVIVYKGCLFSAVSSGVFDHYKLYTLITINCTLYRSIIIISIYTILLSGARNGAPLLGCKSTY